MGITTSITTPISTNNKNFVAIDDNTIINTKTIETCTTSEDNNKKCINLTQMSGKTNTICNDSAYFNDIMKAFVPKVSNLNTIIQRESTKKPQSTEHL